MGGETGHKRSLQSSSYLDLNSFNIYIDIGEGPDVTRNSMFLNKILYLKHVGKAPCY